MWLLYSLILVSCHAGPTTLLPNIEREMMYDVPNWKDPNLITLGPSNPFDTYQVRYKSPGLLQRFNEIEAHIPTIMSNVHRLSTTVTQSQSTNAYRVQSVQGDNVFNTIFYPSGTLEVVAAFRATESSFHMTDVIRHQWRRVVRRPNQSSRWGPTDDWAPSLIVYSQIENANALRVMRRTEVTVRAATELAYEAELDDIAARDALKRADAYFTDQEAQRRLFIASRGAADRLAAAQNGLVAAKAAQLDQILVETDNGRSTWRIARDFGLGITNVRIVRDTTLEFTTAPLATPSGLPERPTNALQELEALDTIGTDVKFHSEFKRMIRNNPLNDSFISAVILAWFSEKVYELEDDVLKIERAINARLSMHSASAGLSDLLANANLILELISTIRSRVRDREDNGTLSVTRRIQSVRNVINGLTSRIGRYQMW
jgi:hypothetical protein